VLGVRGVDDAWLEMNVDLKFVSLPFAPVLGDWAISGLYHRVVCASTALVWY